MPSAEVIGHSLASAALPVLMLDACAILDIVRSPARGDTAPAEHAAAVLRAHAAGACRLIHGSITAKEVADHMAYAKRELHAHMERLEGDVLSANRVCDFLGVSTAKVTAGPWSADLPLLAERLANGILSSAEAVAREDARDVRAMERVIIKRAPAARKSEAKDALLVEEYLDVARCARAKGLTAAMVLLTSNFTDFCDVDQKTRVHPQLEADFQPVSLTLSLKWAQARRLLGL